MTNTETSNQFIPPRGGSEIAAYHLSRYVDTSTVNLVLSVCSPEVLSATKRNIVWQQLNVNEAAVQGMDDPSFVDSVDAFVYNSHWCYEQFRRRFNVPANKSFVIRNGVCPFAIKPKPRGKIKLVYTSTPWRGLEVLLKVFSQLKRDDIELDIYSSTIIYGSQFHSFTHHQWDPLFEYAKTIPGVNYRGYAENSVVREALLNAHILSYPNTWEETSCMAVAEAMAAGCQVVTTNLGALYETCGEFGTLVPYGSDLDDLVNRYACVLNQTIDTYWEAGNQARLHTQANFYNKQWSWANRAVEWRQLLKHIGGTT